MIVDTLAVFIAVVEHKHFSKAAEALHISQPGVSMHISKLEKEFGTPLFHRSPKRVHITEAGQILYKRAKQMLALYDEAKQNIDLLSNIVTGTLKVGASFTIGEYILPRLLAEYAGQFPQVDIQVNIANTEEVAAAVRNDMLHIGLIEGQTHYADLTVDIFMEDEMVLVAPCDHPLADRIISEADLLQQQVWIVREPGSGTRSYSDQLLRDYKLEVKRTFMLSSSQGVKEAVSAGLGIALMSKWIVRKELKAGEIKSIVLANKRFIRPLSIVQKPQPVVSKAVEMFVHKIMSLS